MGIFRKKREESVPSEQEILMQDFQNAKENLTIAEANFNNADPDFFEIANRELTAAQENFNAAAVKMKKIADIDAHSVYPVHKDFYNTFL